MGKILIKTQSRKLFASFQSSVGLGSYEVLNNEKNSMENFKARKKKHDIS